MLIQNSNTVGHSGDFNSFLVRIICSLFCIKRSNVKNIHIETATEKKQSVGYIVLYRDTDERKWEHSKVQKLATMVYKEERKRKRRGKQCQPVLTIYMVPPKN